MPLDRKQRHSGDQDAEWRFARDFPRGKEVRWRDVGLVCTPPLVEALAGLDGTDRRYALVVPDGGASHRHPEGHSGIVRRWQSVIMMGMNGSDLSVREKRS